MPPIIQEKVCKYFKGQMGRNINEKKKQCDSCKVVQRTCLAKADGRAEISEVFL